MTSLKTTDSVLPAGAPYRLLPAFSHLSDYALSFFLKNSYLFDSAGSHLQHERSLIVAFKLPVAARGI